MTRSLTLAVVIAVAGCSAGHHSSATRAVSAAAHASANRGPAVVTGEGDLAACPRKSDLDQYLNDMPNLRLDPGDPGFEVARAYDLRIRGCIELKKGERVTLERSDQATDLLVRPSGQSQTYWTTSALTYAAIGENGPSCARHHR